jgi:hypothetical protein
MGSATLEPGYSRRYAERQSQAASTSRGHGGRTGLMREVAGRVSKRNDSWAETINSWWNGLGDWKA